MNEPATWQSGRNFRRWIVQSSFNRKEKTMSIIWMLLVGLIVGAIAKLMMPGKDPGGIFITMLLGVAGALVAGFLGRGLGWYREGEPVGWFASIIGAVILLGLYRLMAARRAS
jgi:uncharacterized membrane protein YeaQ/YmgE (transglycosylase-associated protein family)